MVTLLVTIIIIGIVWYFVDRFLLIPYTPQIVRVAVGLILTIIVILLITNGLGFTHINMPRN